MTVAASEVHASGAVISVRPRSDGTFGITVGPGPDLYWYVTNNPPKLGTDVTLHATALSKQEVGKGTLTVLGTVAVESVPPAYATRFVANEWKKRVRQAVRKPLYRYQIEGAGWLASQLAATKGSILGDDMGLGKSLQTVAALVATRMFPAIVVCPASCKIGWAREFENATTEVSISIINRRRGPIDPADVLIINQDLLPPREEQLLQLHARTLVLDEAHGFKHPNPPARHRAMVATRLASWIGRPILLTGTPVFNRIRDLWRLLHIASPSDWPLFEEFVQRYCQKPEDDEPTHQSNIVTSYGRVEYLEELHARVEPILLRRLKHEVLADLPPKSSRKIIVELDELDMAAYRQAEADVVAWIRSQQHGEHRARAASRAQTIVKLTTLRYLAVQFKMRRAIPEYLEQWFDRETIEPLVIFGFHKDPILSLYRECVRILGADRVSIMGSADSFDKRQRAIDAFNEGHTDVFIAPIKAGGVGINLQARASDVLFVERLWEPTMMAQAEDRVHRIGAVRPVTITYIDAAGTIDEYIAELTEAKETLITHALDDSQAAQEALQGADLLVDRYAEAG
jgi:SNF2 family DNA or RNA helicase